MTDRLHTPNIADPDGFYEELLSLHDGLTVEQSHALNARLILILCNLVGDRVELHHAFELAKKSG